MALHFPHLQGIGLALYYRLRKSHGSEDSHNSLHFPQVPIPQSYKILTLLPQFIHINDITLRLLPVLDPFY